MRPFSDFERYLVKNTDALANHLSMTINPESVPDEMKTMSKAEYKLIQEQMLHTAISCLQVYHNWLASQLEAPETLPDIPHHESN